MAEKYPRDFGEYRLLRKLAQGGMAEIFLAQDTRGGICAVKRILPHLAHEEAFIRMFIDEARIVSHLRHPNIAQVYDQGKHDGFYYIAMEYVQGHSLLALFERARSLRMQLPLGLLGYVVADILAALGTAHAAKDAKGRHLRIVHRDVTPQNVLISYDGWVKLIDFGVAKAVARLTSTEAGFTKGKLSYMSPEQARGEELDGRSDLFSVGIILYEITTGVRLFNKEGPGGILGAIVNDPIPKPSLRVRDYPRELEDIVMKALAKRAGDRWSVAEEMRDALMRFVRKERPTPGRSRLKDLVHDLFGEPEDLRIIDRARASLELTPEGLDPESTSQRDAPRAEFETSTPRATRADRALAPTGDGDEEVDGDPSKRGQDETRMMSPSQAALARARPSPQALEATKAGVPVLDLGALHSEIAIPEPKVPFLVRAARFLDALGQDVTLSWRAHRRRYLRGALGLLGALILVALWRGGVLETIRGWLGGGVATIREMKEAARTEGASQDASAVLSKLTIVSDPPGAAISVDGLGMGVITPHELDGLPTGRPIELRLDLVGHRSRTETVTLWAHEAERTLSLTLERIVMSLRIETRPNGAEIRVNGERAGLSPMVAEGLPVDKSVEIEASLPGRRPARATVEVVEGPTQQVVLELPIDAAQIPDGTIAIESTPSGCDAFVDGVLLGRTPIRGHSARPGPHELRVRCEHYDEDSRTVAVQSGVEALASFALTPTEYGYLTLRIEPALTGTKVYLGGQEVAQPIEFWKLMPGRHEIVVENEALSRTQRFSVDIKPGDRIERVVHLHR